MRAAPFLALVLLVSGYVLWSFAFVAVYAGHSLACASLAANPRAVVIALWAPHLALHAALLWALFRWRTQDDATAFVRNGALALAATSAVVTLVTGLPAFALRACV